jgi:hypothetical protein
MSLLLKISDKLKNDLSLISIATLTLIVFMGLEANAQNVNPRIAEINLIVRADADSIVLRWAPSKSGGWVVANQIGYIVDRAKLDPNKPIEKTDYKRLNNNIIKPLSLDDWKLKADEKNMFSAIAAQALYGKLFNPQPLNADNMNVLKNAADELSNRYSFSLFAADNDAFTADALGLRIVDKDIEAGSKYAYRIYLAEKTDQYAFDTTYLVVDAKPYQKLIPPAGVKFESGDGNIKLIWEDKAELSYSGYYVFRSEDKGKSFQKMNSMPIVTITPTNANTLAKPSFLDTLTQNYKSYIYQIKGMSPFAELSEAAEINAFSKDLNAPNAPLVNKPEQISTTQIKLSWKMENTPDDIQGFIVSRSNNSLHNYRLLTIDPLPKTVFSFIDDMGGAYEAYYTIAAVDTAGNMAFSLPVMAIRIDGVAPSTPLGLQGIISKSGVVTLSWNKGKEINLKGYRVLRANDPTHKFIQLTGQVHQDTVFTDSISLQTLTKKVYYRIAAVNDRYQHSEMSEILGLKRPDVVAPVEAVFSDVFVTDTSVVLKWHASTSEDVQIQILLRKKMDQEDWNAIDTLDNKESSYIDYDVESRTVYEYTIVTVDESGLKSDPAFPVKARPYDSGKRKSVENLVVSYNQNNNTVTLNWTYKPKAKERFWYVVYKAKEDGIFKEYKALESNIVEFMDNSVRQGKTEYGIVVMTSSGGESEMEIVNITIEETK